MGIICAMLIVTSQFSLPAVFTIGLVDNMPALEKYALLLTGDSDGQPESRSQGNGPVSTGRNHIQDIVTVIIEGETRSIVSNMTTRSFSTIVGFSKRRP